MFVEYDSLLNEISRGVVELSLSRPSGKVEGIKHPVTRAAVVR